MTKTSKGDKLFGRKKNKKQHWLIWRTPVQGLAFLPYKRFYAKKVQTWKQDMTYDIS